MGVVLRGAAMVCGLACVWAASARGQSLTVLGAPPPTLRITTAVAGSDPTAVASSGLQYSVKAFNKNKPLKIMVSLNSATPPGVTLTLDMVAPAGAVDDGTVTLDATARELVGNITNTNAATLGMTYTLSATAAAGVVPYSPRTVTFTLIAWP
jgi:hypothetical protein